MIHPVRQIQTQYSDGYNTNRNGNYKDRRFQHFSFGSSTVRGLAFGSRERLSVATTGIETEVQNQIPSYNEVMYQHRVERVPMWQSFHDDASASGGIKQLQRSGDTTRDSNSVVRITKQDVQDAVHAIQMGLLQLDKCKISATNYAWDDLSIQINHPTLRLELEKAASLLKESNEFLTQDARNEIGFGWGRYVMLYVCKIAGTPINREQGT